MHHRRSDDSDSEKICAADTRRGKRPPPPVRVFLAAVTADPKIDGDEHRDSLGPVDCWTRWTLVQ